MTVGACRSGLEAVCCISGDLQLLLEMLHIIGPQREPAHDAIAQFLPFLTIGQLALALIKDLGQHGDGYQVTDSPISAGRVSDQGSWIVVPGNCLDNRVRK